MKGKFDKKVLYRIYKYDYLQRYKREPCFVRTRYKRRYFIEN